VTKGTEWLVAIQLVKEHGSRKETYFFILTILNVIFDSKFIGNECKGASSSIHPKRKTNLESQSNHLL
jgi:hypothetical protein